jgi:hypothetical protein
MDRPGKPVVGARRGAVSGSTQEVTDASLARLGQLSELGTLMPHETRVTDEGLGSIEGLVRPEILSLVRTPITDAGLDPLGGQAELEVSPSVAPASAIREARALLREMPIVRLSR